MSFPPIHRVVTGHDAHGKAIVSSNGALPMVAEIKAIPGTVFHEVWCTGQTPVLVDNGADPSIGTIKPVARARRGAAPGAPLREDPSGLPPVPDGGLGQLPLHAAAGAGYGQGFAGNDHRHVTDGWLPSVKFLIEELKVDVNARDFGGYTALHFAAGRGDNEMIKYLVSKGADVKAVARNGQTTADMANGPVQRISPYLDTVKLLEELGSKNNHKCVSC